MAKKNKDANAEIERGDTIMTIRNGQRLYAVVTETDGGIRARATIGDEFPVDGKNAKIV